MNILYHHRTLAADAQGVHIRSMIDAFRDLGHDVREAALVKSDEEPSSDKAGERPGWIARMRRALPSLAYEFLEYAYSPAGFRRLGQVIAQGFRPDVIYERYSLGNAAGVWMGKRLRIPVIIEVNAPLAYEKSLYEGLRLRRLAVWSERRILSRATRVIAVTSELKRILVDEGVPASKIDVMSNGVRVGEFDPTLDGRGWRSRLSIGHKAVIVGFVGWFREWHGLDRLVDLAATQAAQSAGIHVLLVGDGPARRGLEEQVARLAAGDRVHFVGPQPHSAVPELVAAFDIAVQPQVTDYACPMKLIEYLAAGRAVVAPRKPNIEELVRDGESASLFDPSDREGLAAKVLSLAESAEHREALAKSGLAVISDRGLYWKENARRVVEMARRLG